MKLKKWLAVFAAGAAAVCVLYAGFQIAVDPFGIFGDRFFNWYAYDMTQNPRAAKIAYLNAHHGEYDSYVIGSSKASSLSCEKLNGYLDARFYNLTWYGGKIADECAAAAYLIDNFEVKNIVLLLEPQNAVDLRTDSSDLKERMHCDADGSSALSFYLSYLFCNPEYALDKLDAWFNRSYLVDPTAVYIAETGVYNKQRRDIEAISVMDEYLAKDGWNFPEPETQEDMLYIDECVEEVRQLKALCAQEGIRLIVLLAPQYRSEFSVYPPEQRREFWRSLAGVTDFWDFSGLNSVNCDPRYFYDWQHFRNCAGDMALARMFGGEDCFVPEDFGVYVTGDTVEQRLAEFEREPDIGENSRRVPVLMYHSVTEDPSDLNDATLMADTLRSHLEALREAGYESVSYGDLVRYVQNGVPLPEKPVVITFDDGYANNLTLAAPMLEEYGFSAQIAVIGCSVGKDTYKDTGEAMTPHFSLEEAQPWIDAGIINLHSHSYDMHQVESRDGMGCRAGLIPLDGESEEEYTAAVRADHERAYEQLTQAGPADTAVFTYPYGRYSELSEVLLSELGVSVTVSTNPGVAEIVRGLPQSLRVLDRINVTNDITPEALLAEMQHVN